MMNDWFDGALTVRQFLPGEQIWRYLVGKISGIVEMPTGNNDQLPLDVVSFRQLYCSGYTILVGIDHLATTRVGHQT